MSDMTPPAGTPADRGRNTPDARGESAVGTPATDTSGIGTGSTTAAGTPGTREGGPSGLGTETAAGAVPAGTSTARSGTPTAPSGTPTAPSGEHGHGAHLLPHDECDQLAAQLQHAVTGFVDRPRDAVEEADHVLEEIASRFTDAVAQRRRTLRRSWQSAEGGEGKPATSTDTEQLRLALQDYRELADRLLHV